MDSASYHLGTKLIMRVRQGGKRLTNRRTKLFAKRRRDCLHHAAPDVDHDNQRSYPRDRADTTVALDLTQNTTTREMRTSESTATSAAPARIAPSKKTTKTPAVIEIAVEIQVKYNMGEDQPNIPDW